MGNQGSYRAVLHNRSFLALWIAQIFSQLGDRVCFVVFVAVIAKNIGDATSYQSWLYVAFTIPAILLTAVAGVFVDRWSKKNLLIATNVVRGGLLLLLPLLDNTLLTIYALAFCVSAVTQFFVPAEAACIPMLVDKKQLLPANSLFTTTMMASVVFGFVLGDPLIDLFGIKFVNIAITGLFFISALCLIGVHEHSAEPADADSDGHENKSVSDFFEELKQGFNYIRETPVVLNALLKLATLFSIIVSLCILSISISTQMLYEDATLGAQKFVYIVAYSGLGMVIGAYLVGKVLRNRSKYMLVFTGFAIMGISLVFLAFTGFLSDKLYIRIPSFHLHFLVTHSFDLTLRMVYTYFVAAFLGLGAALVAIPVQTILQTAIPENMRGKVFGFQYTMLSTASTLPVIIVALGADIIGVSWMLFIIGMPLLVFGVFNLYNLRKNLKRSA